jgi:hypothetical protein
MLRERSPDNGYYQRTDAPWQWSPRSLAVPRVADSCVGRLGRRAAQATPERSGETRPTLLEPAGLGCRLGFRRHRHLCILGTWSPNANRRACDTSYLVGDSTSRRIVPRLGQFAVMRVYPRIPVRPTIWGASVESADMLISSGVVFSGTTNQRRIEHVRSGIVSGVGAHGLSGARHVALGIGGGRVLVEVPRELLRCRACECSRVHMHERATRTWISAPH